jgi:osmotically-inducible protein OsmY
MISTQPIQQLRPPEGFPVGEASDAIPDVVQRAEARLRGNPYLAGTNVSCSLEQGAVVLRGCLPNYYLWRLAQDLVGQVPGVERVVNEIQVVCPPLRHI